MGVLCGHYAVASAGFCTVWPIHPASALARPSLFAGMVITSPVAHVEGGLLCLF